MTSDAYYIISEITEDRFDETDSLEEAVRRARSLASEGQAGEPISIERGGKIIRQLVLMPDGKVLEQEIA